MLHYGYNQRRVQLQHADHESVSTGYVAPCRHEEPGVMLLVMHGFWVIKADSELIHVCKLARVSTIPFQGICPS